MDVYALYEPDADPYCGGWVVSIWSTLEKAQEAKSNHLSGEQLFIYRYKIDSTDFPDDVA